MPRSIWTKEREARFKTDFFPQKPDIEELQMCIDGLQKHRIDLEQQLAAANARIAEMEASLQYAEFVRKEFESALMDSDNSVEAYKHWRERAEQAEEKVKRLIKKITFNTPRLDNFGDNEYFLSIDENDLIPAAPCVCDKLEQAEAQAAAMRVCGNCRHFSTGYTEDLCAKPSRYGETTRQSTCNDWEMIW